MNITILTYLEREQSANYDAVVSQVADALKEKGQKVSVLGVHGDLGRLIGGLRRRQPDLVFNLMEMFGDNVLGDVPLVGLLDLLKLPYTGGGPGEYYLQQDKALAKKLLSFDGILYPDFAVFSREADLEVGGKLRLPLFVKPLRCDGSIGINGKSLVHGWHELMEQVLTIHNKIHDSALAEEYIEGRELYVGVLGNAEPLVFPPVEIDFTGFPEGKPHVLDERAKWHKRSPEYKGSRAVIAELSIELRARVQKVALDAYRALRVRDYGRIDLRVTEAGEIYVIEVNASCYLERSAEFVMAAAAADIDYSDLIQQIADLALERHEKRVPAKV